MQNTLLGSYKWRSLALKAVGGYGSDAEVWRLWIRCRSVAVMNPMPNCGVYGTFFAFFSDLLKRMFRSLRSFAFF